MTGDDVANSLYYVHLDNAGDELLVPKAQRPEAAPRASMDSMRSHEHKIARKPVPASARVPQNPFSKPQPDNSAGPEEQVKPSPVQQTSQNKENVPIEGEAGCSHPVLQQPAALPAPRPAEGSLPSASAPLPRKPLGPRQMDAVSSPTITRELPHPLPEVARPATPPILEEERPPLPSRPPVPPLRLDNTRPAQSFDEIRTLHSPALHSPATPSRSPSPWSRQQKPFTPFSLTIIRRNPGTGHQWNIGKVTSFQSTIIYHDPQNPDAEPMVQYPRGYPAINIHIETSGYARFRDFPTALPKVNFDATRPGSAGSGTANVAQSMKELAAQMQAAQQQQHDPEDADTEGGFRRQVVMTYGKTWTHNLKEAFASRKRERSATTSTDAERHQHTGEAPLQPPRAGFHQRADSDGSTASWESSYFPANATNPNQAHQNEPHVDTTTTAAAAHRADDQPILKTPGPGLRPKGYTFTSPWDGRCDFRTASNGRSLKCRHTRNTTSQGFNPLVAAQALRDATAGGDAGRRRGRSRGMSASVAGATSDRVDVSELRFNLPSSDLFGSKEDRERAAREVVEGFGRMLVKNPDGGRRSVDGYGREDEDDDDYEPIFDFSGLGRERAGGGNRGKRAKLGKLLVHDEGLKMLDLVVAANMGIWWQAWERSF